MKKKDYVIHPDQVELERLKTQGLLVTDLGDALSAHIPERGRVVDVACGAGEWANRIAKFRPHVEVIGLDIYKNAIDYAREQSIVQQIPNVEFMVADIFDPLPFDDTSCDFINMRFVIGVLPRDHWIPLLRECYRILKPGGIIQLVESEVNTVVGAPNYHVLQKASYEAFWKLGKSFASTEVALGPMLPKFLQQTMFHSIVPQAFILDYSYGTRAHEIVTEDFILAAQSMQKKGLFTTYGGLTQEVYDEAFDGMCSEMRDNPDFAAFWYILCICAVK